MLKAEGKLKKLFEGDKVIVHKSLSLNKHDVVVQFYKKFEKDKRLVELKKRKEKETGKTFDTTLPDNTDLKIFAQSLNFSNPALVTTDDHFYVLCEEIGDEFGLLIIHDDNAYEVMRGWDWIT